MLLSPRRFGRVPALALLAGALVFSAAQVADARVGGGRSSGSRGSRTYSAPAPTATAPTTAQPIQRSVTQPGGPTTSTAASRPTTAPAAAPAARPSMARSLLTGIAGGLVGAGLFGLLSGSGFFGGLASLAGMMGFLLQIGLLVLGFVLIRRWLAGRSAQPAMATAGAASAPPRGPDAYARVAATAPGSSAPPVNITSQDYDAFQRSLGVIQTAYGREDVGTLRMQTTPEMAAYFEEELAENRSKGVLNRVGKVELLKGDLSESWAEQDAEYATVAMRYALADAMVERGTGRILSGSLDTPQEFTEVWTFRREPRESWKLSAIQQVQ